MNENFQDKNPKWLYTTTTMMIFRFFNQIISMNKQTKKNEWLDVQQKKKINKPKKKSESELSADITLTMTKKNITDSGAVYWLLFFFHSHWSSFHFIWIELKFIRLFVYCMQNHHIDGRRERERKCVCTHYRIWFSFFLFGHKKWGFQMRMDSFYSLFSIFNISKVCLSVCVYCVFSNNSCSYKASISLYLYLSI